jgi:hypothetical protein
MPGGRNPLIGHYKELFSRPENDSEVFYGEGHKIMKMPRRDYQNTNRRPNNQMYNQRNLAKDLMESEQFNIPGPRTPSPEDVRVKGNFN